MVDLEWINLSRDAVSNRNMTFFFSIFVFLQFWNMFNAKAYATGKSAFKELKNSTGFLISALVILIGQILIVQFGGEVFRTVPLSVSDWIKVIGLTSPVLWAGEINRLLKRQRIEIND